MRPGVKYVGPFAMELKKLSAASKAFFPPKMGENITARMTMNTRAMIIPTPRIFFLLSAMGLSFLSQDVQVRDELADHPEREDTDHQEEDPVAHRGQRIHGTLGDIQDLHLAKLFGQGEQPVNEPRQHGNAAKTAYVDSLDHLGRQRSH